MSNIVLIKLTASNINAIDSHLIAAGAKLTAAHGFANKLLFDLFPRESKQELAGKYKGFIYIHHDMQLDAMLEPTYKNRYLPQQRRGAFAFGKNDYVSGSLSQGLQPVMTADIHISLIIAYDESIDLNPSIMKSLVANMRFAGGIITKSHIRVFDSIEDAYDSVSTGFVVIDRKDIFENSENIMVSAAEILTRRPNLQHTDTNEGRTSPYSFLALASLGYKLLYDPRSQIGALHDYPHSIAEPIIGAIQYVSIHQLKGDFPPEYPPNNQFYSAEDFIFHPHFDQQQRIWVLSQSITPETLIYNLATDHSSQELSV